jgi:hypothetical protein
VRPHRMLRAAIHITAARYEIKPEMLFRTCPNANKTTSPLRLDCADHVLVIRSSTFIPVLQSVVTLVQARKVHAYEIMHALGSARLQLIG